jgi:hypothetical protein
VRDGGEVLHRAADRDLRAVRVLQPYFAGLPGAFGKIWEAVSPA